MDSLNITEGMVAFRCWYYTDYDTNQYYESVVISTHSRHIVISWNDANNLLQQIQRIENNYGEPQVIGVNNYLEYSAQGTWNQYVYIDRDSVKFGQNDQPIDLRRFSSVLQKTLYSQSVVKGYRDKSDLIEMRFWGNDCQFFLKENGELYFVPIDENPNWYTSAKMDKLVEMNDVIRNALKIGRKVGKHADIY